MICCIYIAVRHSLTKLQLNLILVNLSYDIASRRHSMVYNIFVYKSVVSD
jgi:hypothetical protein